MIEREREKSLIIDKANTRELTADEDIGSPVSGSLGAACEAAESGEFDGRRRLHAAGSSTAPRVG
jgi:hypothetical protein